MLSDASLFFHDLANQVHQWTNCETAKHHGSLVTEQNFASWRL